MILVTHGIVGAAVGRLFPKHPIVALLAGIVSHFLIDAIPHWHYKLFSAERHLENPIQDDLKIGKSFLVDLVSIGTDFAAGIAFSFLIFPSAGGFWHPSVAVFWGAIGGILPDPIQFLYMKWRHEPLRSLQRFHLWIHSKLDIDKKYFVGIVSQVLFIAAVTAISKLIL